MIWGSGGSKSRLAKAAGAELAGQMRDEKLHAVVARSTFASQNVQNTRGVDHFWQLRCPKSARRCGAKHISKSKCTKHHMFAPLLLAEMSKKCTPLWREAHFQVKMYKTLGVRTTFGSWDVEKVHAVVARSTFRSQNVQNTTCSRHFCRFRCRFAWQAQGIVHLVKSDQNVRVVWHFQLHYITLHYTPLHYTTLHYTTLHYLPLHCITQRYTTLHYTTLHYTTLHYTTFHYTSLHYTTLHNTTTTTTQLHSTTQNYTTLHYITLHYTPLHYITLHYLPLHFTTLHYTPQHYNYNYTTTLHYTKLHSTTQNYTTSHYTTLHYITLHDTTFHYITLHYTPQHYNYNYTTTLHYTPFH